MDGYISGETIQVQCEKCTLAIEVDAKNGRSSFFGYENLCKNVPFLSHKILKILKICAIKYLKCEVKMSLVMI